jgi:phosphate starvation-inducible protein PhoH and related proteins
MARRQLELSNAVAAEMAGAQDRILRTLEEHLECAIYLRGNVVTLDGDAEAVQAGATVVRELSAMVDRGHELGPAVVESVARVLDERQSPAAVLEDVVWRHRNLRVAPRSVNQKRYVDAIRRSTVTFGVGPAGTGKTFLAIAMAVAALSRRSRRASASASCPAT